MFTRPQVRKGGRCYRYHGCACGPGFHHNHAEPRTKIQTCAPLPVDPRDQRFFFFFTKGQRVNILGFVGHIVSITTIQLLWPQRTLREYGSEGGMSMFQ